MDPLSNVLSLLNARGMISGRAEGGGEWCFHSQAYSSLRFGTVIEGTCWLHVNGMQHAVRLQAGDCYLLTDGRPYRIGSDLTLPGIDMREIYARVVDGFVRFAEPVDFQMVGGRFSLEPANASLLLDSLPPVIHVSAGADTSGRLPWVLGCLTAEQLSREAGFASVVEHLTHVMLVQILRIYLKSEQMQPLTGWLAALADPKIGAALIAMHSAPTQRWTLVELARTAGMSRSAFALRFKILVGKSPLDYLLRWRMRLAGRALSQSKGSISSISLAYGYDSETAFSAAFKRVMGLSPRAYRAVNT